EMPLELLGSRPPIVRALFSLQDARNRARDVGPAAVSQVHVHAPAASNDMMMWGMETQKGLLVVLNYNADLFDGATIRRFLSQFVSLLGATAKDPKQPLERFSVLPDEERQTIANFGRRKAEGQTPDVLTELAERARSAPSAVAIRGLRTLTFAELDAAS